MVTNDAYRRKFGLHTEHMRRANAKDQLVGNEKKIQDVIVANANLPDAKDEVWIKDLLEFCAPKRVGPKQRLEATGFFATLCGRGKKEEGTMPGDGAVVEEVTGETRV
jgi:hypothetical protein